MAERVTTTGTVDTLAESTGAALDGNAQTGSTPKPDGAADAAPAEGSVEYWQQKAKHFEAEAKKAFEARDKAKGTFFDSEDGKKYAADLAKAKQDLAEFQKLQAQRAEQEALEKGEFKTLYESHKKQLEQATGELEALRGKYTTDSESWKSKHDAMLKAQADKSVRTELALGYARLGGIDPEAFQELVTKQITSGAVRLDESGQVVGVEEVLKQFKESKGYLFGSVPDAGPGSMGAGTKPKYTGLGGPSLFTGPHTKG